VETGLLHYYQVWYIFGSIATNCYIYTILCGYSEFEIATTSGTLVDITSLEYTYEIGTLFFILPSKYKKSRNLIVNLMRFWDSVEVVVLKGGKQKTKIGELVRLLEKRFSHFFHFS
jgi:hypothetical protein